MKVIVSTFSKLMLIIALILSPALAGKLWAQPPAGTPYVDLITASPATAIRLKLAAGNNNTTVWIRISENNYTQITIGTAFQTNYLNYTPVGSRLRVFGAVTKLDCSGTSANDRNTVVGIEFSTNNTTLKELYCSYNQITGLNLTQASALQILNCSRN